jgi:hypothetical protein
LGSSFISLIYQLLPFCQFSYVELLPSIFTLLKNKVSPLSKYITDVDEASGRYNYDCSGFLDYSIQRVMPEAYAELPSSKTNSQRPLAQDFYTLFSSKTKGTVHWKRIRKASDLRGGDIVAWLRPKDNDSKNTGHVMLVRAKPSNNPNQPNEILIPVIDSTSSIHANAKDNRLKGQTGLGTGTIGVITNDSGEPISYHWWGGESRREESTPIAFGRVKQIEVLQSIASICF